MDLLGRARGFLKGLSAPPVSRVQYFSVVCPEGHRVRGQRTEGYQALRCPACGEGVFVLPASPLPEPEPPPRKAARRAAARRPVVDDAPLELKDPVEVTVDVDDPDDRRIDAEIIWDDEAEAESPAAPTPSPATVAEPPRKADEAPTRRPRPKPQPRPAPAEPAPRVRATAGATPGRGRCHAGSRAGPRSVPPVG